MLCESIENFVDEKIERLAVYSMYSADELWEQFLSLFEDIGDPFMALDYLQELVFEEE